MMIADLHIHSKYARATSRDCDAPHLDLWARYKGIDVVGTGDFTHPGWRKELEEALEPAEEGLYRLREELRLPAKVAGEGSPRFLVSGEISTIYKRDGRTRKVHHVILLPSLQDAEALSQRLEAIGNLHSDGRPILGLDSRDLLAIVKDCCPRAVYIPAHVWTPHFSVLGEFSGFETLEQCYGDLAGEVRAVETGLSSDPPMNRRLSALDRCTLISNSDAHSPSKLGREATLLDCEKSYSAIRRAIETGEGLHGTIEFFPEEGKYHLDGHRACAVCLEPARTQQLGGRCPVCGRKLTVGVKHRVEELADRAPEQAALTRPYESLMPLDELLAACMGVSAQSKRVREVYFALLAGLGSEFAILRRLPPEDLARAAGFAAGEGLRRLRAGQVIRRAGYDGLYGVISLFEPGELEVLGGQTALFSLRSGRAQAAPVEPLQKRAPQSRQQAPGQQKEEERLNPAQRAAVEAEERTVAVIAGPGTGKTKTLVARIADLINRRGVSPADITAVTFTNQAAQELKERLSDRLGGKKALRGLHVGTFHALCLEQIEVRPLAGREQTLPWIAELLRQRGESLPPSECQQAISRIKNGGQAELPEGLMEEYHERLRQEGVRDLDDVLLEALERDVRGKRGFAHLLVDEFQDINAVQHALVEHWSGAEGSLFVIGDPDQSIYGFRGADAGCFDALRARRPDLRVIELTENYRSAPAVLDSALCVINRNPGRVRALQANRPNGPAVRAVTAPDAFSEGVWIAGEIGAMVGGVGMLEAGRLEARRSQVRAFGDIAVLCRTHRQLERIEGCLRHDGIPCIVSGRSDALGDETAQGMVNFVRSLLDPGDGAALRSALGALWGCPKGVSYSAEGVWAQGDEDALDALAAGEPRLAPWLHAARELAPRVRKERPRRLLEQAAELCGAKKSAAVQELMRTAALYDRAEELAAALTMGEEADVRRLSGAERIPSGAVRLMTLHAAKGLEFPVVFLAGVQKGELPLERPGRPADLQEERRLFFVGLTRAREELVLTCGGEPSPMLDELGPGVRRETARARRRPPQAEQLRLF